MPVLSDADVSRWLDDLPELVKRTRSQRHLTLRQAGEQIGMAYGDLSRFENGLHDPQLSTLRKLAAWLADDPYTKET